MNMEETLSNGYSELQLYLIIFLHLSFNYISLGESGIVGKA